MRPQHGKVLGLAALRPVLRGSEKLVSKLNPAVETTDPLVECGLGESLLHTSSESEFLLLCSPEVATKYCQGVESFSQKLRPIVLVGYHPLVDEPFFLLYGVS